MKRSEDRYWYDKGYSDAWRDARRDSKVPKVIGVVCLSALLAFDQYWVFAFVVIWVFFELAKWRELNKWHESDPPERWES